MSFTDNGETVTDNNTGLMWQKQDDGNTYNWYQASGEVNSTYNPSGGSYKNVCGSLNTSNFSGHSDWQLPSKKELITIVDYSVPYPCPTIQKAYFPQTQWTYWSSTTPPIYPVGAWAVFFQYAVIDSSDKGVDKYVRCVRGGHPAQTLTDNHDGTVTDNKTGLEWQQDEPGEKMWGDAISYCRGLSLGGHDDWRLPNIKEIESLTDDSRYTPVLDYTFFPGALGAKYWSSTTDASFTNSACFADFGNYGNSFYGKDIPTYVRCVRGGRGESSYVRLMRGVNIINTFDNIQDAYNNAQANDVIQAKNVVSTENQTFVATKAVSLKGGYDSGFNPTSDFTTVNGNMTIIGGTVTVENIIIK
jgi:hypothetical protein